MKKAFKKIFIVLFTAVIILVGTAPISSAESKHLIVVNSKKNTLNYYVNYTLVRSFRCSTGKLSTPTPQCKTTIVNKIKNRPYYKGNIPGGAPNNPLGKRWMGLNINGTYGTTYAIHGNNNESSIGKNISGGCIRMHNSEVEWLFDQVPIGTVVLIKSTTESDNYIMKYYNMGSIKASWYTEDKKTYYKNPDGTLAKGWQTIDGNKYYFGATTGKLYTGWAQIGNKKYYLGDDGVMVTGKQTIDGVVYEFDSNGVLIQGGENNSGNNKPSQDTNKPEDNKPSQDNSQNKDDNKPSQDTNKDDTTKEDNSSKEENSSEQNEEEQVQEESAS